MAGNQTLMCDEHPDTFLYLGRMDDSDRYREMVRRFIEDVKKVPGFNSQAAIGKPAGVSGTSVGRWLNPEYPFKAKIPELKKISDASGVPLPKELLAESLEIANGNPGMIERRYAVTAPDYSNVVLPIARQVGGEKLAKRYDAAALKNDAAECEKWLNSFDRENASDITSHCAQFLLLSVGILAGIQRPAIQIDLSELRLLALRAADYLVSLSEAPARKSQ